jgi:hypothetical protein
VYVVARSHTERRNAIPKYTGRTVWLLATTYTFTSEQDFPFRRIVEPNATVYQDASPNALAELQKSFKELQEGKCLSLVGYAAENVGVYDIGPFCFQKAIFTRIFPQALVAGFFLFELLILGHAILSLLRRRPSKLFLEGMMSVGLGITAWIMLLWLVALLGFFEANVGWLLILCVPIICYRSALYWGKALITHTWDVELHPKHLLLPLVWLLVSYLALNFLVVIRPFPTGRTP